MKDFIKTMKAVSDPNRVKILKMLEQKELCVCELQALLGLAQPTISKHLKLLEDAGLVVSRKEKLWVNYTLAKKAETIYARTMLLNMKRWLNDDHDIADLRLKSLQVNRDEICKK